MTAPLTVAVMQPYFFPYAGYYRLFAAADIFVIYDCVQFPRRGRVHRCEVPSAPGGLDWLTLPLARQPRGTLIRDLAFADDAEAEWPRRLARHPWIAAATGPLAEDTRQLIARPHTSVVNFLSQSLKQVASSLAFTPDILHSSDLALAPELRGQDRILAILGALKAGRYVNAPGGRSLYDSQTFAKAGIELCFLPPYQGRFPSMLHAMLTEDPVTLRDDILATTRLEPA